MFLRNRLTILSLAYFTLGCAHQSSIDSIRPEKAPTEVVEPIESTFSHLLNTQAKDWNRGALEAFCSIYSEDAVFISPSGQTIGRQAILQRYQKKYSTPEKRGQLTLTVKYVRHLDHGHAAGVILEWKISYPNKEAAKGWSLVVFQKVNSNWMIVQDASM